jgi:hypothetical protein
MATSSSARAAGKKAAKSRPGPDTGQAVTGPRAGRPEVPLPPGASVALQAEETGKAKAAGEKAADQRTREKSPFLRVARPDSIDFRDRPFRPAVSVTPQLQLFPRHGLEVLNQADTKACTGFALALVVQHLLRSSGRERKPSISPYMLYSMARRYDEFPGSVADEGSSLRGALKGWFKHGACSAKLFPGLEMPAAAPKVEDDWWFDAVTRPLGAYYRIEVKNIIDMHAALNEVGILYASCGCHSGWDAGVKADRRKTRPTSFDDRIWTIPVQGGHAEHPGHAFAIVGYNERGFLIQNSWGTDWGSHGYAILTYDDWLRNAMDCWVAQLGVVTREHSEIAHSISLRERDGRVSLSASEVLRNRELSPFIIDMGNNGALSPAGTFRTTPDDVRAIVDVHLAEARRRWGLQNEVVDVCVYAHGGLVGEEGAARIAAEWIPMLYEAQVFPIFLMWETDFLSTVMNRLEDAIRGVPRSVGFGESVERWWNRRLERTLARPGSELWGEMKQNAQAMSTYRDHVADDAQAGAVLLYRHFKHNIANKKVRMHLVGHSAGSIVASYLIDALHRDPEGRQVMKWESVSFMAPAVRVETFDELVRPHLDRGDIQRFQQFHLTDRAEEDDPTCGPYRRSLLYLVSESFESGDLRPVLGQPDYFGLRSGTTRPVLGMEKFFNAYWRGLDAATRRRIGVWPSPGGALPGEAGPPVGSSTHGGFDNDPGTQRRVVEFIHRSRAV